MHAEPNVLNWNPLEHGAWANGLDPVFIGPSTADLKRQPMKKAAGDSGFSG
jgi:hypothetical protein